MRYLVFILLVGTTSAATVGCVLPVIPSAGGNAPSQHVQWTGPFVFTTDFPLEPREPWVGELLEQRKTLIDLIDATPAKNPIRVVVFDSRSQYQEFMKTNFADLPERRALFIKQKGRYCVYTWRGEHLVTDLRHETTHAVLHSCLSRVPVWVDEGLAEYFEVGLKEEGLHLRHLAKLRADQQSGWRPNLRELEKLPDDAELSAIQYRECWLWVHFCLHHSAGTRRALIDYIKEAAKGEGATPVFLSDLLERQVAKPGEEVLIHLARLAPELGEPAVAEAAKPVGGSSRIVVPSVTSRPITER